MTATSEVQSINRHIGRQVCRVRLQRRLSQTQLADRIGTSFQQIHRYECGDRCISASTLVLIARALAAPISDLLSGLEDAGGADAGPSAEADAALGLAEAKAIAAAFPTLSSALRRNIVALVQGLAVPHQHATTRFSPRGEPPWFSRSRTM